MSFVGVYQGVLFYIRSVQTILLLLVVPLFVALGLLLTLITAAAPRAWPDAVVHSRLARALTFPAIPTLVIVLVPFVLYFSPWYAASLRSGTVRELTYLALLALGIVFFWKVLRCIGAEGQSVPGRPWASAGEVVGDAGWLAVHCCPGLIAGADYHALARLWAPACAATRSSAAGWWVLATSSACRSWRPVHPDDQGGRDRGRERGR